MSFTKRWLFFIAGLLLLALAGIGLLLPVVPSSPFVLLAAYCFSKSSPRFHQYLLDHRWFGPGIKAWEAERCISLRAKLFAVGSMFIFGCISMFFLLNTWPLRAMLAVLMAIGCTVVLCIKTCSNRCCEEYL